MQPAIPYSPSISERLLIAVNPLWSWFARRFPKAFALSAAPSPHPSAMLSDPNWIYRLIFPRFFRKISVDDAAVLSLSEAAQDATIVYISKFVGQLEYSYFNHLFVERKLPLVRYSNALTLRRWMKPRAYLSSVNSQSAQIAELGRPLDPISDGFLPDLIAQGQSVLIRIPQSELEDEQIVHTGPLRALAAVIEAQRKSPRPIVLMPLDFLWSRRPRQAKKSIIDILFGEKESPGRIRKCVLFWRNYKERAHALLGSPIDVSAFLAQNQGVSDDEIARRLRQILLAALRLQRCAITGPPIRSRAWFIQEILSDDSLDNEICRMAAERGKGADEVRMLARRYAKEIVSDLDYTYVELLEKLLGRTLVKLFESFEMDAHGLGLVKEAAKNGPIVFVPNHRSHVDYLVLSYILYNNGMAIPHIAAGANLSFWPLGKIFRKCGAFFIRRSFRGNPLYRDVLTTYLKIMLREGHPLEFFIEGGRSRSGKLMHPKLGMLRMLHRAARDGDVKGLCFVPVSIAYDRVIEQKSYEKELGGAGKEKEKTSHLLRLTKYLRRQKSSYGSIYVRFGRPIPAAANNEPEAIVSTAQDICHEINRRTVVTPAAVAAAALLASGRQGIIEVEFIRNANAILAYLTAKGVEIPTVLSTRPAAMLRKALTDLAAQKLIVIRQDAIEPFIAVEESKRVPLSFFRNGIAHFLAGIAVTCCLIDWHLRRQDKVNISEIVSSLDSTKRLLSNEFKFATRGPVADHVSAYIKFLESQGVVRIESEGRLTKGPSFEWEPAVFASQIQPYAENLWICARYVEEKLKAESEERILTSSMIRAGEDMFMLGRIRYREAVTKEAFGNSLLTLSDNGCLIRERQVSRNRNIFKPSGQVDAIHNVKVALEKVL